MVDKYCFPVHLKDVSTASETERFVRHTVVMKYSSSQTVKNCDGKKRWRQKQTDLQRCSAKWTWPKNNTRGHLAVKTGGKLVLITNIRKPRTANTIHLSSGRVIDVHNSSGQLIIDLDNLSGR